MEPSQESQDGCLFFDFRASQHLVHVDGAYPGDLSGVQRLLCPLSGRALAQRVDQNSGVEQQQQSSADTARVAEALRPDPGGWICIPLVALIGDDPQPSFDVFPAPRIVECPAQGFGDECAATAPTDALVELLDDVVIETYVQTHGHRLTHSIVGESIQR
jgi:hypothetical protein